MNKYSVSINKRDTRIQIYNSYCISCNNCKNKNYLCEKIKVLYKLMNCDKEVLV